MKIAMQEENATGGAVSSVGPSPPSPVLRLRKKEKVFKATVTRDGLLFLAFVGLPAVALGWQGASTMSAGDPRGLWLIAMAGALVLGAAGFLARQLGQSIRVTPNRFIYEHGKTHVIIPWEEMKKFFPPSDLQRVFRVARISDGHQEVRIDSMAFAEFDLLVSLIGVARKNRGAGRDSTYDLR